MMLEKPVPTSAQPPAAANEISPFEGWIRLAR